MRETLARFVDWLRRGRLDRELSEELTFHRTQLERDAIERGLDAADARAYAHRRLGNDTLIREQARERWLVPWLAGVLPDFHYATRAIRRAPAFSLAVILTLALGIGANAAIFSVVDGVLLRPAPFARIDRLAMLWETDRAAGTTREPASIPDFGDFQQRNKQFAALAAFSPTEISVTADGNDPSRVAALAVTESFLSTLGVTPAHGRLLIPEETRPGGPRGVVVSERFAKRIAPNAATALGRTLRINGNAWTIVGVVPDHAGFGIVQLLARAAYGGSFASRGRDAHVDVWVGLRAAPTAPRDNHPIFVIGRLADGATVDATQGEATRVAAELERAFPSNANRGVFIEPVSDAVFGPVRPVLLLLLASVALVLLVACGNVANLLLARGAARARETSVRLALGASTASLVRQYLTESALLTALGATVGVGVAFAGTRALLALAPATLPRVDEVVIDSRVLAATLGVSLLVCAVFGAIPLLIARKRDLHGALQSVGRGASGGIGHRRLRTALVIGELAMAVMLMSGAGLLMRSLWRLHQTDPGFVADGVLKAEFELPVNRYPQPREGAPKEILAFHEALESRLRSTPGVVGVAIAASNPLDAGFTSSIRVVGREAEAADWPEPAIRTVTPSYFPTMRVPITDGRSFAAGDGIDAPPVIAINESARERYFGTRPALGQRISLWGAERTIVAIVGNEHLKGLHEAVPPAVYMPLPQVPISGVVLIRVTGDPRAFVPTLRNVVSTIDAQLPLFAIEPLSETLSNSLAQRRFAMTVLITFAIVALVLSAIGVHGVLSYSVTQRTRELGIRMALGATTSSVRALVVGEGMRLVVAGLAIGVAGALALTGTLSSLLFGVSARDPVTLAGVSVALGGVALLASYLPARRASRSSVLEALRSE